MNNSELMHQLNKDVARINGYYERWCQHSNINSLELRVLYALYLEDSKTQKEICESYAVPKQSINNVVKELEKRGYLELLTNDNDHRSKLLKLTADGFKYMNELLEPELELDAKAAEIMGSKDLEKLVELQAKFADAVKQAMEEL